MNDQQFKGVNGTNKLGLGLIQPKKKLTIETLLNNGWIDLGFKSDKPESSTLAQVSWNVGFLNINVEDVKGLWVFDAVSRVTVKATSANEWQGRYIKRSSNEFVQTGPDVVTFGSVQTGAGSSTFRGNVNFINLINEYEEAQRGVEFRTLTLQASAQGNVGFASTRYEIQGRALIKI